MGNGYYPLIPGGRYYGPEPDNYTGDSYGCDDPREDEDSRTWQTLDGRRIPFQMLEEKHLLNILRTCRAGVVKASVATQDALLAEIRRRGLEPLPDYESYEEAMAVACVTSLYTWWKRIPDNRRDNALTVFILYIQGTDVTQFLASGDADERSEAEKMCITAVTKFDEWRLKSSPAAQMRCSDVLKRWAYAMHINEALGLS